MRRYSFATPSDLIPPHQQFRSLQQQQQQSLNGLAADVGSLSLNRHSVAGFDGAMQQPFHSHSNSAVSQPVVVMPNPSTNNTFYRQLAAEVDCYFSTADDSSMNSSRLQLFSSLSRINSSISQQRPAMIQQNSAAFPSSQRLYCVQFKGGRLDIFYVPEGSGLAIKAGDLVIVDADRGKDLGKVTHEDVSIEAARELKTLQHNEQQAALQQNTFDESGNTKPLADSNMTAILQPKQIIRFAQPMEIQQLFVKKIDEEKAQKICMTKVEERGMPMQIRDAEYQW